MSGSLFAWARASAMLADHIAFGSISPEWNPGEPRSVHHLCSFLMAPTAARISNDAYASQVDPQCVRLLNLLEMKVQNERCSGVELTTTDGRGNNSIGALVKRGLERGAGFGSPRN